MASNPAAARSFTNKTGKLFTMALAAGTDQERLIALDRLDRHLKAAELHPSEVQFGLPSDEEDDDYELIAQELESRLEALEERYASLQAENNRLARQRAIAIKEAEAEARRHQQELSRAEKRYQAALASENAAREAAVGEAEKYRTALADRVARTKRSRLLPIDDAALDRWNLIMNVTAGFSRNCWRRAVAAIAGISEQQLNRFSELRDPLPMEVVNKLERYVAQHGHVVPEEARLPRKNASRPAATHAQALGVFDDAEIEALRELQLDPATIQERIRQTDRAPSPVDRELWLVLSEGYGIQDGHICMLLGLAQGTALPAQKEKWVARWSQLARTPVEKLRGMLRKRDLSPGWADLLSQAVAA
ncbi:hypothetical protein ABIE65_005273 [Constrictibacter sp. MBR-5]|jgi:hypothetical protein|uniref:hypothetical protein n=1 Tax=Constrictibacter sp. MBR-5 TaxID=3156467 RepID=UPI0033938BBB